MQSQKAHVQTDFFDMIHFWRFLYHILTNILHHVTFFLFFLFSILGMNLFGCKFCNKADDGSVSCDRKNFDSLLWAIVTVFQVLNPLTHLSI